MHTGPTASPENSYLLQKQDQTGALFRSRHVRVITHSPNIDIGVLRQISNIYTVALSWAVVEQKSHSELAAYLQTPDYALDQLLSQKLKGIVMKMPNGAIPTASSGGKAAKQPPAKGPSTGFMSSLMRSVMHLSKSTHADSDVPHFTIDEYTSAPFASNRSNMKHYSYISRPNSDRCSKINLLCCVIYNIYISVILFILQIY
jgi:hypothetical protein